MNRRLVLEKISRAAWAVPLLSSFTGRWPAGRANVPKTKIPLGLCDYSLRSMRLNARQLLEYALSQKLDSVLLNTLHPFKNRSKPYLSELARLAAGNQISIYVGVGSISKHSEQFGGRYGTAEALLLEGIRVASLLHSPVVACRIGSFKDRRGEGGIEAHIEEVIKVMKSLRAPASDARLKFAFENHMGDLRSDELNTLIKETGTDICGALFDPANALWALEDPIQALDTLRGNILCTSVRDVAVWKTPEGAAFTGTAVGEGILDFAYFVKVLAGQKRVVPFHVETISNRPVWLPFLDAEYRKYYPSVSDSDLRGFLGLLERGREVEILKTPPGKSKTDFEIQQQQQELRKSFAYLRKHVRAGLKK